MNQIQHDASELGSPPGYDVQPDVLNPEDIDNHPRYSSLAHYLLRTRSRNEIP